MHGPDAGATQPVLQVVEPVQNDAHVEAFNHAAKQGAQIILIPELFEGHYFCKDQTTEDLNRAIEISSHPTVAYFAKVAKELSVVLPISVYERANNTLFNSVAIVDADGKVRRMYPIACAKQGCTAALSLRLFQALNAKQNHSQSYFL